MGVWDEAKHPRIPGGKHGGGEFTGKPGAGGLQQAISAVKEITSDGRLDYNPAKRDHITAVKDIAAVLDQIPPGLRASMKDRISRISVEDELSVPGYRMPLGMSAAGCYEPQSRVLHVSTEHDVGHVIMHEMMHALDNNLAGGHRFGTRRDWLAICRGIWSSDYAKTRARSYFVPSGYADHARAGRETFAELLACYLQGKPLSLTYSGQTPLPPELDSKVRAFFAALTGK